MSKLSILCEKYDKETDELISTDTGELFEAPLAYLKEKKNEYVYINSESLEPMKVDGVALEYDEVFEVYTAMFGFAVQKKFGQSIKTYLNEHFHSEKMNYSLVFSGDEGLWEINLPLDYIHSFDKNFSIEETYHFLLEFIRSLAATIEN